MPIKVACPYCGLMISPAVMDMHKASCKKAPVGQPVQPEPVSVQAQSVVVPPVVQPVVPPPVSVVEQVVPSNGDHAPWEEPAPSPVEPEPEPVVEEIHLVTSGESLFTPDLDTYFVLDETLGQKLDRILSQTDAGDIMNLMFTGPRGAGKTSLAKQIAAKGNRKCYIVPCMTMNETSQWWGMMHVSPEKGTYYIPSAFVEAVETPGCVVILDDMNRTDNPKVLNGLFKLLDSERATKIDDLGRYVRVAPGVIFVSTVNEGFEYQGTDPIDLALRSRFSDGVIPVSYPPQDSISEILVRKASLSKRDSDLLADFATQLAHHPTDPYFVDMRQLISMGKDIVFGASVRDAVQFVLMGSLEKAQIEKVNQVLQNLLHDNFTSRTPQWRTWGA